MPKGPTPLKSRSPLRRATIPGEFIRALRLKYDRVLGDQWPSPKWQKDPVGFARMLSEVPYPHQVDFFEAILHNPLVAISSGQKIGKTWFLAVTMWWYFCSYPNAKVTLTATTETQVDNVVWDEMKNIRRRALAKGIDLLAGGTMAENPRTGIESPDGRSVRGLTVRQIEAMGGISGENMLFVADEASSLSGKLAEAMAGNTAGDARMLWTSNPTRSEGPFYDAFHKFKGFWKTFMISSEDIAAKIAASGLKAPGIATSATIKRWEEMWGRDSPFFIVRVLGKFLQIETGKICPLHLISAAQNRYKDYTGPPTELDGVLKLGVDAAGAGEEGDEWGFCLTRGKRTVGDILTERGLDASTTAVPRIESLLKVFRKGQEIPVVVIDAEGEIGSRLLGTLKARAEWLRVHDVPNSYEVHGVRSSQHATREVRFYERVRDELWANVSRWLKEGGAIPPDYKLESELHAAAWTTLVSGKAKATSKDVLREFLGRSPDRADALCLSVWEPKAMGDVGEVRSETRGGGLTGRDTHDQGIGDMVEGNETWWPDGHGG
jgi:hypothetical protein